MVYLVAKYHIAGNFRGRNLLQIGGKYNFAEKTFAGCSLVQPKDATLPNFTEMKSQNLKIHQSFSLKSFPQYGTGPVEQAPAYCLFPGISSVQSRDCSSLYLGSTQLDSTMTLVVFV